VRDSSDIPNLIRVGNKLAEALRVALVLGGHEGLDHLDVGIVCF